MASMRLLHDIRPRGAFAWRLGRAWRAVADWLRHLCRVGVRPLLWLGWPRELRGRSGSLLDTVRGRGRVVVATRADGMLELWLNGPGVVLDGEAARGLAGELQSSAALAARRARAFRGDSEVRHG